MHSSSTLSPLSPSICLSQQAKSRQQLQAPCKIMSVLVLCVPGSCNESTSSSHSQGVPLNGVDWENRVIGVERLVLQLISEAGSEPQLPTRSDSRAWCFELAVLFSDRGSDRGLYPFTTLSSPAATCGVMYAASTAVAGDDREALARNVKSLPPVYFRFWLLRALGNNLECCVNAWRLDTGGSAIVGTLGCIFFVLYWMEAEYILLVKIPAILVVLIILYISLITRWWWNVYIFMVVFSLSLVSE